MEHQVRNELSYKGILAKLANYYTSWDAQDP